MVTPSRAKTGSVTDSPRSPDPAEAGAQRVRVIETRAGLPGIDACDFMFGPQPAALALAFVSPHVDFNATCAALRDMAGSTPVLALTTAGELCGTHGEAWYRPTGASWSTIIVQIFSHDLIAAVSLHAVPLHNADIRLHAPVLSHEQRVEKITGSLAEVTPPFPLVAQDTVALTFIDGLSVCENTFMEAIYRSGRFPCLFVGASSAGKPDFKNTFIHDGGKVVENHAVIAFLKLAPGMRYGIFKTHHFRKTDQSFDVLDTAPDRRTVSAVLNPETGEIVPILKAVAKTLDCAIERIAERLADYSFGIEIDDDLYIRSVRAVDIEQGTLSFYCDVNPGDELLLLQATDFVARTQSDLAAFLHGKPEPVTGILCDCLLRRRHNLSSLPDLGQGWRVPVAGFSTFGELLGIQITQTLTALFFFDPGSQPFHDDYVDAFPLRYARYCNYFTQSQLKRVEILNRLRSGLMCLLLEDTHSNLARRAESSVVQSGNFLSTIDAIQHAIQTNAVTSHDTSDIESLIAYRLHYEERLWRQANFDDLTGLPNRALMLDRLGKAIAQAQRATTHCAVLYIDLDRFKYVNDTQGHAAGDKLLQDAAIRLTECIREGDTLARMGGDEFVIILPSIEHAEQASRVAERVVQSIGEPFMINRIDQFITASVGIAIYPEDAADKQSLLRNADLAMYKAKEAGRNGYQFFTQEINISLQRRIALESRLRGALERGEMRLHYQPIINLRDNRPCALEALLRWQESHGPLRFPPEFIPVAEEIGLIKSIGDWVVATACHDLQSRFAADTPFRLVAVNVSPQQLQTPGFARLVETLLAERRMDPNQLELEITESVIMDDRQVTTQNIKRLCAIGVRLSIDDFGTGYSSLGRLQRYPFDTLKIDRVFINTMIRHPNTARLVETIIAMAHGMGLKVVAEGVETPEQLEFLRLRDCDQAQGYLFGRPVPPQELTTRYSSRPPCADPRNRDRTK